MTGRSTISPGSPASTRSISRFKCGAGNSVSPRSRAITLVIPAESRLSFGIAGNGLSLISALIVAWTVPSPPLMQRCVTPAAAISRRQSTRSEMSWKARCFTCG